MSGLCGKHPAVITTPTEPNSRLLLARKINVDGVDEFRLMTPHCNTKGSISAYWGREGFLEADLAWVDKDGTSRNRSTATPHSPDICETVELNRGPALLFSVNGETVDLSKPREDLSGMELPLYRPDRHLAFSMIHTEPERSSQTISPEDYKAVRSRLQKESLAPTCYRSKSVNGGERRPLVFAESPNSIRQITSAIDSFRATLELTGPSSGKISWVEPDSGGFTVTEQKHTRSTADHPETDRVRILNAAVLDTAANRMRRRWPLAVVSTSGKESVDPEEEGNFHKALETAEGEVVTEEVQLYASNCHTVDPDDTEELTKLGLSEVELRKMRREIARGSTVYAADTLVAGGGLGSTLCAFDDEGKH